MKDLKECLEESLNQSINEGIKPADEKVFWQWIEDLGPEEVIDVINKSAKKDYEDFYKLVSELGTTEDEFEKFVDIFYEKTNAILELIEDDEDAGLSDDGCEYASWSAPFYGKKKYEQALKSGDWKSICIDDEGEHCGYAMSEDDYEAWLEDNDVEPKGYAK